MSAYTPDHYVSGACGVGTYPPCGPQSNVFPYQHDFGSILAFIENNFGLGIGSINSGNGYPFADAFAPEYNHNPSAVPLADFFSLTTPKTFEAITMTNSSFTTDYFLNYSGPPADPDNDVIDND